MFGSSSRSSSWQFWLRWVFANVIGWFAGWTILSLMIYVTLSFPEEPSSADNNLASVILFMLFLFSGGVLGFSQWAALTVLKSRVHNISWWMPVTSGSFAISFVAAFFLIPPLVLLILPLNPSAYWLYYILIPGAIGLIVGLAQFSLIRRQMPQAKYWILGSIFGWISSSLPMVGILAMASSGITSPSFAYIFFLCGGAIGGGLYGAITGQVWKRLIRNLENTL